MDIMCWMKLDEDCIPEVQVLAANFKEGTYGYKEKLVGYLYYSDDEECVVCSCDDVELLNVTHYINIDKYDIEA